MTSTGRGGLRLGAVTLSVGILTAGAAAVAGSSDAETLFRDAIGLHRGTWLGVRISDLTERRARELGLPDERGALIEGVMADSPADEAGLEEGDVVLSFDGERVRSSAHLGRLVRETPAGRAVRVEVSHDGNARTVEVELATRRPGPPPLPELGVLPPLPPDAPLPPLPALPPLGSLGQRYRLGIAGQDLGEQLAEFFDVEQGSGVLVSEVVADGAADEAGLEAGDVIVRLDDETIDSLRDLRRALGPEREDPDATVTVVRRGREREVKVELEEVTDLGPLTWQPRDREAWDRYRDAWRDRSGQLREHYRRWSDEWRQEQREHQRQQRERGRELRDRQRELEERARDLHRGDGRTL